MSDFRGKVTKHMALECHNVPFRAIVHVEVILIISANKNSANKIRSPSAFATGGELNSDLFAMKRR